MSSSRPTQDGAVSTKCASLPDNAEKLQMLCPEKRAALEQMLLCNDIAIDRLVQRPEEITTLEMFLFNYPKKITDIACLESCTELTALWLVECHIHQIQGLENLAKLTKLYLYSNKIHKIQGLNGLPALEVLWLADNRIGALEGLDSLPNLTELNLARNKIVHVTDAISKLSSLTSLNLANNNISSFKASSFSLCRYALLYETHHGVDFWRQLSSRVDRWWWIQEVMKLAQLPKLRDLCFSDPHWGDSPLACLCNYQTYVLFTLPYLTSLDTLMLAEETKQLAEATYVKKKMYYNMRIKTMRRNAKNMIRSAKRGKEVQMQATDALFDEVVRQHKQVLRELEESAYYPTKKYDQVELHNLRGKLAELSCCIDNMSTKLVQAKEEFSGSCCQTQQLCEEYVHRMSVELETGGNIRLEDGKPSDLWCTSCMDLVKSRFCGDSFMSALGITGIHITRVTKVHNRFLRNRFEQHLATVVDNADASYKQSMEYLLFASRPGADPKLSQIIEEGFIPMSECGVLGSNSTVCVTNSLGLVPSLGPTQASTKSSSAGESTHQIPGKTGRMLVVKVFLGRTAQDDMSIETHNGNLDSSQFTCGSLAEQYPECNSVYRTKADDVKQKLWYIFDHTLVLPEYLVDFEYNPETSPLGIGKSALAAQPSKSTDQVLQNLPLDVRPIAHPLLPWLALQLDGDLADVESENSATHARWQAILANPPIVPDHPKIYMISEKVIDRATFTQPHSTVVYLNLHNNALRNIERLESLRNLRILVLSFNEIQKIDGIAELVHLERLELGYNCIKCIEGVKGLRCLTYLELNSNCISSLDGINVLRRYTPQLATLDLRNNPLCKDKCYRSWVVRQLECLTVLDGCPLTPEDRSRMSDNACCITDEMILDAVMQPRSWSVNNSAGGLASTSNRQEVSTSGKDLEWLGSVEELVLKAKNIRWVSNLKKMTGLRRLYLCDNEITRIEGLENCEGLFELSFEDNRISSISGLERLGELRRLELGSNLLITLENLQSLTNLTQLSLEDNQLTSLEGLEALFNLMELYAGNNCVVELRAIQQLKELPKLIILDLLGNPVCRETEYRLYTIYHLRKLKVLDGQRIESAEQASAKSQYAGRLTLEFLEERLGHRFFDRIRELDISGLRLRDVGRVFQVEFESLQHLNLDNNLVTDASGVMQLSQLTVLRLNGNRIGDQCSFKAKPNQTSLMEQKLNCNQENRGSKNASQSPTLDSPSPFPGVGMPEMFPYLQVLQLGDNQISSIASLELSNLTSLQTLFLHRNEITKIDGLNGLVNLKELVLDGNRIKYIDPGSFCGLSQLQELRMEENGLRSLANLHPLAALRSLQIGMNRVTDVANLDKLSSVTSLVEISMANNPVCRKQVYRAVVLAKCPTLVSVDNQPVTLEEREYVSSLFAAHPSSGAFTMDPGSMLSRRYGGPDVHGGHGSKVPIRMTALNFESFLAHGIPSQQHSPGPGMSMASFAPSIPGMNSATPRFGLEGVGIRDNQSQGKQQSRFPLKTDVRDNRYRAVTKEGVKLMSAADRRTRLIQRMYY
ncbi:hypothetical protein BSKO_00971 [Bryopsis sp. KO-2023]|nr:hypothetical protein BSKO_00971 [Bryopsis sp. KO-2023]